MNESLMAWMPLIILFLLMWLLIFLPNSKREKQRQAMLNALKSGDRVETVGRIFGIVDAVEKDEILLCVGLTEHGSIDTSRNSTRIRIHRDGIARVITDSAKKE